MRIKGYFYPNQEAGGVLQGPLQESVLFNIHIDDPDELTEWILSKFQITMLLSKRTYTGLQEPYEINQEQIGDLAPGKDIPLVAIQAGDWLQGGKICWKVSGSHSRQQADQKPSVCPASRGPKASWAGLIGIQPVDRGTPLLLKAC